ncbi:MAG: VOC family protein [Euzebya sp.]
MHIESLSAVTLVVRDMDVAVAFYDALGLRTVHGGSGGDFTSYAIAGSYLNLQQGDPGHSDQWGRVILHVSDVDAMWRRVVDAGGTPDGQPEDAPWGERYFHVRDPDGHELSFARPLDTPAGP